MNITIEKETWGSAWLWAMERFAWFMVFILAIGVVLSAIGLHWAAPANLINPLFVIMIVAVWPMTVWRKKWGPLA